MVLGNLAYITGTKFHTTWGPEHPNTDLHKALMKSVSSYQLSRHIHTLYMTVYLFLCCVQMFLADDYELQGLCRGHCPFCRKTTDSLSS